MPANKVGVVSAFVPLNVKHMSADQYHDLGSQMMAAAKKAGASTMLHQNKLEDCWSYGVCTGLPPATDTPADRYATPEDHVRSHIVQHTRTQWALQMLTVYDVDVLVWLDYGILKQGKWNGNPVTPEAVTRLVEKVAAYDFQDIPFPGIEEKKPVLPHGNNWRFCGSTHVWPAKWLPQIHRSYQANLTDFIEMHQCVPLDLAIWPMVEENSGLPFKWYKAEYDSTQLENFPCAR